MIASILKLILVEYQFITLTVVAVLSWYARDIYWFVRGVRGMKSEWPDMKDTIGSMKDMMRHMNIRLIRVEQIVSRDGFAGSNSPRALNDEGEKIADTINATQIAKRIAPKITALEDSKNAYDIQELCFTFAGTELPDHLTEGEKETIKNIAFDKGVGQESVFHVVGIVLRDLVLEEKGIPVKR